MLMTPFTTVLFSTLIAFLSSVSAYPLKQRDVWAPPITYPTRGTVWTIGHNYNVTWNTTHPPAQITNTVGMIVLVTDGLLDLNHPLATGFSILDGSHQITVPDVAPGN
ncbi:hypothetical protein JAAARDRAFT_30509, partial [Jaapia argillacea MUCL 33604]